jgi:hypothetical protein
VDTRADHGGGYTRDGALIVRRADGGARADRGREARGDAGGAGDWVESAAFSRDRRRLIVADGAASGCGSRRRRADARGATPSPSTAPGRVLRPDWVAAAARG